MFEYVLLVYKSKTSENPLLNKALNRVLSPKTLTCIGFDELTKRSIKKSDLIITFGGDGTFIKAANLIEDAFILGVNSAPETSEGALTSIIQGEFLDMLPALASKTYPILKRQRAIVILNGRVLEEHALNEVYVGTLSQFHSSHYKLTFKDHTEEHRSSGVIVSTGTGSSAWFHSAGGHIFHPSEEKLSFIVREPYFGNRVFKPTLLKGNIEKHESLRIEAHRDSGGIISINEALYPFNRGDVVEISLSPKPLQCITFLNTSDNKKR